MTKVHVIRTHWAHWGAHSGITQFLKYLTPSRVEIREQPVVDGNRRWKRLNDAARPVLRQLASDYYKLTDLGGEIRAGWEVLSDRPDVLHYLDADTSAQFLPRCGPIRRRTRIVASYHQPPDILRSIVSRTLAATFDRIITVSSDQAEFFASQIGPDRVDTILHGIDTDFFRPAAAEPRPPSFRCLTVGFWLRDFQVLERVVRRLSGTGIEFHVVAPEIGNLPVTSNLVWHRGVSDETLLRLYQQADVLLLPLLASTANNALLEGLACGLPVLTTRLPSVMEYLGGAEAILAAPGDEDTFAEGLDQLRRDAELRQRMGRASRRRAEELDWRRIASEYERVYSSLSQSA